MEKHALLCPKYEHAIKLLGKPWTGLILRCLQQEPLRFTDLKLELKTISAKVLTQRIKELESANVLQLNDNLYTLSDKGKAMSRALDEIQTWADRFE